MFVDRLEPRRLMSGDAIAERRVLVDPEIHVSRTGTLFVTGRSEAESIRVHYRPSGRIAVDVKFVGAAQPHASASFKRSEVRRLHIDAGAGGDIVQVDVGDLTGASTLYGGLGDDQLTTRGVNTQLFGEAGDDMLVSDQPTTFKGPTLPGDVPSGVIIDRLNDSPIRDADQILNASYNALWGGTGNDRFRTFGGEDSLFGGSGDDRFEEGFRGGVEKIELAAGGSLPGLTRVNDVSRTASRVGLRSVTPEERPAFKMPIKVDYDSLRPASFA